MRRLSAHRAISPLNHPFTDFNGSLTDSFNNSLGYLASILTPNLLHGFPAACRTAEISRFRGPVLGIDQPLRMQTFRAWAMGKNCVEDADEGRFIAYSTSPLWLLRRPSGSSRDVWCGDYSATPGVLDRTNSCDECCTATDAKSVGYIAGRQIFIAANSLTVDPHPPYTREVCMDSCWSLSYSSAGVEMGNECWCGNITSPGVMVPMSDCNSRCMDDAFESCGGLNRLQVYHFQGTFN
ncbi:hypothetical protein B0H13DRAFT_1875226 [Mycena leptocephala]|nr:hypothetical protein B0H13DRAFT_1875226 [Mycena leptocephala]